MSISQDIQYLIDKPQDYRKVPAFNGSETRNPGLLRGDRLQLCTHLVASNGVSAIKQQSILCVLHNHEIAPHRNSMPILILHRHY